MKTLVNKNIPAIRITAPEVEQVYDKYYYIIGIRLGLLQENWTLVEEEPTEGIKGILEEIPSNVDLEKETIIDYVHNHYHYDKDFDGYGHSNRRPVRTWQKRKQQMKTLEQAAEDFVWEVMENDENGISDLCQKLRPTSKISDFYDALAEFFKAGAEWHARQEQEVAERFARIVRVNLIGIDKRVQEKFEQLYVEVTGNKMYGGYND